MIKLSPRGVRAFFLYLEKKYCVEFIDPGLLTPSMQLVFSHYAKKLGLEQWQTVSITGPMLINDRRAIWLPFVPGHTGQASLPHQCCLAVHEVDHAGIFGDDERKLIRYVTSSKFRAYTELSGMSAQLDMYHHIYDATGGAIEYITAGISRYCLTDAQKRSLLKQLDMIERGILSGEYAHPMVESVSAWLRKNGNK